MSPKKVVRITVCFFVQVSFMAAKEEGVAKAEKKSLSDNVFLRLLFQSDKNYGMFCPGFVYGRWGRERRIRDRGEDYEAKAGECEVLSDNVAGAYKFHRGRCCKFLYRLCLFVAVLIDKCNTLVC